MAALEKIRNKAGLLIGFVGFALFAFIIGDFITNGSAWFNQLKQNIGNVEGREMSTQKYSEGIKQFNEVAKMEGQNNLSDAQVRDEVWDRFVYTSLLENECEKIGLTVTDEEFQEALFGAQPHPMLNQISFLRGENGYDPRTLQYIIANKENPNVESYYRAWKYWEGELKNQMLLGKYRSLLSAAMAPTKKVAENLASLTANEYDLAVVRKPFYEVADSSVSVTDNDIKKIYDEKKASFKTEPYRSAKVIIFNVLPSKSDYEDVEAAVTSVKTALDSMAEDMVPLFVTQNSDREFPYNSSYLTQGQVDPMFTEFAFSAKKGAVSDVKLDGSYYKVAKVMSDVANRPDSVKASRIIVFRNNQEESQVLADSLKAELKKGADFKEMVKKFSQDAKALVDKDGDMDWFTEGIVGLEGFDDAVFTANVGDYFSFPVQQAVMLVKVTDKTKAVKKVKLAEVVNKVEAGTDTYRKVYDEARQFSLKNRTLSAFEDSAKNARLDIRTMARLTRNQSQFPALPNSREIIRWAWEHEVGTVSDKVFDLNNQYVVAAVSEAVDDEYVPFSYAKADLENDAINVKKAEKLIADMKDADLAAIGSVDTIKSVSLSNGSLGRFGAENAVMGAIAKMDVNQVSAPIKGAYGVYKVQVLDKRSVEVSEALVNQTLGAQNSAVQSAMYRNLFSALKNISKVKDTRYEFY
ncbi:MAG: SurA N-terminal domain-containing protein [Paludibacteraceae bacterium]|nr:SurA N-terminal domain-containing protein [Paludibacteraceae bacterium]